MAAHPTTTLQDLLRESSDEAKIIKVIHDYLQKTMAETRKQNSAVADATIRGGLPLDTIVQIFANGLEAHRNRPKNASGRPLLNTVLTCTIYGNKTSETQTLEIKIWDDANIGFDNRIIPLSDEELIGLFSDEIPTQLMLTSAHRKLAALPQPLPQNITANAESAQLISAIQTILRHVKYVVAQKPSAVPSPSAASSPLTARGIWGQVSAAVAAFEASVKSTLGM